MLFLRSFAAFVLFLSLQNVFAAGSIPGVEGPKITFVNQKVILTVLLTEVELEGGLEFVIPRTVNSTASLEPNVLDGGSMVTLKLDVEDIKKALQVEAGDSQTLPCGRPVPGIPGGALKDAIRLDLPEDKYNLSFYFHEKLFGTYIPFNFDFPQGTASIPLKWKGKNIGALALIGKEGEKKAAGTIFLRMDAFKENKEIQDLLNKKEMSP